VGTSWNAGSSLEFPSESLYCCSGRASSAFWHDTPVPSFKRRSGGTYSYDRWRVSDAPLVSGIAKENLPPSENAHCEGSKGLDNFYNLMHGHSNMAGVFQATTCGKT